VSYHVNMVACTDSASVGTLLFVVTVTSHFAIFSQNCNMSLKCDACV